MSNKKNDKRKGKVQLIDASQIFVKMRKGLGNKTNELKNEHIKQITESFQQFKANDISKIYSNEDFFYWCITVERPLRLSFQISDEKIANLENANQYKHLIKELQKTFGAEVQRDFNNFNKELDKVLKAESIKLKPKERKDFVSAVSWKDEKAEKVIKKKDKERTEYEPDTELRDFENVPFVEDIQSFFERNVLPFVPDAWIDSSKTIKGCEVSFTKIFFQYQPLRKLETIIEEIMQLENETEGILKEIVA